MSAHTLHGHREPSLLGEFIGAVLYHVLTRLIEWLEARGLIHVTRATPGRPEFGMDAAYPADLHAINAQLVNDREFGLYCGTDLIADATTGAFAVADYADAWPTGYFDITYQVDAAREAAVDLAFAGGAR